MSADRLLAAAAALLGAAALAPGPAAASSGPAVQAMVVGLGGDIIASPRTVSAKRTVVRVRARRCAVAAGTPLAVLAALHRAGGPAFALRDYGRCGASPAASAELFVSAVGGERNRGQNGWEYKVGNLAGSTGAADPSGARGDGRRLRTGQRVLWFYCIAVAGGCQPTLGLTASARALAPGGALQVTVTGYDNEARGVPVREATVTLGPSTAVTGADGRATLRAPVMPGRYELTATQPGSVPAFPQPIAVG